MLPNGRLLYDNCLSRPGMAGSGVSLEISGTRSGKTTSLLTTLANWHYPQVILDPSCEIGPMMWRYFESQGRRVHIVNPQKTPVDANGEVVPWAHLVSGYNPLDWIDIRDPMAPDYIKGFAKYFVDGEGHNKEKEDATAKFFRNSAKTLISIIIAHIMWEEGDDADPKTLATMRERLSLNGEEIVVYLRGIARSSNSSYARSNASAILQEAGVAEKTWAGIVGEATQATSWLTVPAFANMVNGSDFNTRDICGTDPVTIIFQLPMLTLLTNSSMAPVLFGSMFSAKIASGTSSKTLFMADEAVLLGESDPLRLTMSQGGKHGLVVHTVWQSMGQLERVWKPEGRKEWFDNAAWFSISGVKDPQVANMVSDMCGTSGVLAYNESSNTSTQTGVGFMRGSRGRNIGAHEISRRLLMPHEVVSNIERGQVLLFGTKYPALINRAWYKLIPELRDDIDPSPYEEGTEEEEEMAA
jgi:type IV secretion system protein VirD4